MSPYIFPGLPKRLLTCDDLLNVTIAAFNTDRTAVLQTTRVRGIYRHANWVFIWLWVNKIHLTPYDVAKKFGSVYRIFVHHSTITRGVQHVERLMSIDSEFRQKLDSILTKLKCSGRKPEPFAPNPSYISKVLYDIEPLEDLVQERLNIESLHERTNTVEGRRNRNIAFALLTAFSGVPLKALCARYSMPYGTFYGHVMKGILEPEYKIESADLTSLPNINAK